MCILDSRNKPLIVEITGSPNSGKTSSLGAIRAFFKSNGIKHATILEFANQCKLSDKLHPNFNTWTFNRGSNDLLLFCEKCKDVLVWERGAFDYLCWIQLFEDLGTISKERAEIIRTYVRDDWANCIDRVYIMSCKPDVSIKRQCLEGVEFITEHEGTIVNMKILTMINNSIEKTMTRFKHDFPDICLIDTTDMEQKEINESLVRDLNEFINTRNPSLIAK